MIAVDGTATASTSLGALPHDHSTNSLNGTLVDHLQEVINSRKAKSFSTFKALLHFFSSLSSVLYIFSVLLLLSHVIVSGVKKDSFPVQEFVELCLLVTLFLFGIICHYLDEKQKAHSIFKKAQAHIDAFVKNEYNDMDKDKERIRAPLSESYHYVLRNSYWEKIHSNLLVEGDTICLGYGEQAPCRVESIEPEKANLVLEAGQSYVIEKNQGDPSQNTQHFTERTKFRLLETPAVKHLEYFFDNQATRPDPPLKSYINLTKTWLTRILLTALIISFTVNAIRYHSFQPKNDWWEMYFYKQAAFIISGIFLVEPLLKMILFSYINSRLFALFHLLQTSDKSYAQREEAFDLEEQNYDISNISFGLLQKYFFDLLLDRNPTLSRNDGLFQVFGLTTVVCVIDKEGILSESTPTPEAICLLRETPVLLNLSRDMSKETRLRFEDADWKNEISSLKPLGLYSLLNPLCTKSLTSKMLDLSFSDLGKLYAHADFSYCLCNLAKEIGFSDDVVENYQITKQIFTLLPQELNEPLSSMISMVLHDVKSGARQFISKGDPDMVLELCSKYFNGQQIEYLNDNSRELLSEAYQHWPPSRGYSWVAFSFKPLQKKQKEKHSRNHDERSHEKSKKKKKKGKKKADKSSNSSLDGGGTATATTTGGGDEDDHRKSELSAREKGEKVVLVAEKNDSKMNIDDHDGTLKELGQDQILVGLVAMRTLPKQEVPAFVEALRGSGTRFVYFSPHDEKRIKAFADRLGLETDWNCCISLRDEDNAANADEVMKLPKGISAIREHIIVKDNVPLLVPMFCDATPESIQETIKIFQENGDIVCCIGSGLKMENSAIFLQSDLGISMEPMTRSCLNRSNQDKNPSLLSSKNFSSLHSCGNFSCDLISLPCSLIMDRKSKYFHFLELFQEARRLTNNTQMGMFFYTGSYISLTFMLLLSTCILLPPVLNIYQILWLVCIIIPLLSFSLLFTSTEPQLLKMLSSKRKKISYKFVVTSIVLHFFPSSFVCLFLFYFTLYSTWQGSDFSNVLGFQISDDAFRTTEFQQSLLFSQNILLFSFVLYLGTLCVTFMHKSRDVVSTFKVLRNRPLAFTVPFCVLIQIAFFVISIQPHFDKFEQTAVYIWPIMLCWPVLILILDTIYKIKIYAPWVERDQLMLKLEFDTKLGMHSPI